MEKLYCFDCGSMIEKEPVNEICGGVETPNYEMLIQDIDSHGCMAFEKFDCGFKSNQNALLKNSKHFNVWYAFGKNATIQIDDLWLDIDYIYLDIFDAYNAWYEPRIIEEMSSRLFDKTLELIGVDSDKINNGEVVPHPRKFSAVNYIKLNDEMFGKNATANELPNGLGMIYLCQDKFEYSDGMPKDQKSPCKLQEKLCIGSSPEIGNTRRVDILCCRLSLCQKILSSTKDYQNLCGYIDEAVSMLEKDVGLLTVLPIKMARGFVNRISSGPEIQRLGAAAVRALSITVIRNSNDLTMGYYVKIAKTSDWKATTANKDLCLHPRPQGISLERRWLHTFLDYARF